MKIKLNIKINSLLYNNDPIAINILKEKELYEKYKNYDKEVQNKIVNNIILEVNKDDTVDYIKKKLSLFLFEKIKNKKNQKTCFYCFSDKNINNNKLNEIIILDKQFQDKKIKEEDEEDEEMKDFLEDLDLDLDDEDLDLDLDLDDEEEEIEQTGGNSKKNNKYSKIMICHNCCKCYLFDKYFNIDFEYFNDIYPFPEIINLSTKDDIFGYKFINNQRKKIELMINDIELNNPFENISQINKEFLLKNKKNKLVDYLNLIRINDKKYHKYIKNTSFLLLNNYDLDKENNINFYYLPEICLYNKKYKSKCLDLYSKLYFPYMDYPNYYLKYIHKDMDYNYLPCITKKFVKDENKYSVEELILSQEENISYWGDKYNNYDKLIKEINKIEVTRNYKEYTSKIFYKINNNQNTNNLINFQNIYHLFKLDKDIPYLSSYVASESIVLEKVFKEKLEEINNKKWKIFNKNTVNFRLLLPEGLIDEEHYFQVNLYENMKLEVNISLPSEKLIFITKEKLLKINNTVNKLIKRLNKIDIFNISGLKIPLSNNKFEEWNIKDEGTNINAMNCYLKIESKIDLDNIIKVLNIFNSCMKIYYQRDFNFINNNFRYKRINNVDISDITDNYIYYTYNLIVTEFNLENEREIKKKLIESISREFDKKYEESYSILENYTHRFKSFEIKPPNYGLYFNVKQPEEWIDIESDKYNYKINVMGLRNYSDWDKMKKFLLKLLYITENFVSDKNNIKNIINICNLDEDDVKKKEKVIISKDSYIGYQQEKFQANIKLREIEEDIKIIKNKEKNNELVKQKEKIIKRIQDLETLILKKKKVIKKMGSNKIATYIQRLQNVYPYLKLTCGECGLYSSSKECLSCNIPLQKSQYSKQCQKKRQPMGTSMNNEIQPEIIDFNEMYEKERFNEFQKYKVQLGGKYSIKLQYDIKNESELEELLNLFEIEQQTETIKKRKKILLDYLIKLYNDKYYNIKEKIIIEKLNLEDKINEINKMNVKGLKKNFLYFTVYKLIKKWNKPNLKKIYNKFKNTIVCPKNIEECLDMEFKKFSKKYTTLFEDIQKKETLVQNISLENMVKDINKQQTNYLYRKDKYGNVVQSTMRFKNKAISCPNFDDNKNNTLVGFLDIDPSSNMIKNLPKDKDNSSKIRDMVCQPCCFVAKKDSISGKTILDKKYVRNMNFCKGKINWKQYLKVLEEDTIDINYISTNASLNKNKTYGKLPKLLHNLFNKYNRLYNFKKSDKLEDNLFINFSTNLLKKSSGFVLKGIEQVKNPIFSLLSNVLNLSKEKIVEDIKEKLKTDKNLFNSLNGGKVNIKFGSIDKYINYLNNNKVEFRWIYDILSTSKLFKKYPEGINFIIFKEVFNSINNTEDIIIKDYEDILYEEYYDINKHHVFIYEYPSKELEPIVLKHPNNLKDTTYFTLNENNKIYEFKFFKKNKKNIIYIQKFLEFINNWINKILKTNILTARKLEKKYKIKTQIIDNFNKVLFILTDNNNLIPIIPSKYNNDYNIKKMKSLNDIKDNLKSYKYTIQFINNFSKEINDKNYKYTKLVLDKENKNIVGIQLINQLIIPVIEEKYLENDEIISNDKLFYKINNALYKKNIPKVYFDFIKEKYDFEVYQRLLLEFSNYLKLNINTKKIIEKLLENNKPENKNKIKDLVLDIINEIVIFKESETINYNNLEKNKNNIRELCGTNKDNMFCEKDNNNYKLIISYDNKNKFIGLLIENLISNKQIQSQLINNNINKIININNYVNDNIHIFQKKEPEF